MPTVKDWKAKNKSLLDEIIEFQKNPDLANPYKLLGGLASMVTFIAGILLPQTQALKWIIKGLKIGGAFLKGYSEPKIVQPHKSHLLYVITR